MFEIVKTGKFKIPGNKSFSVKKMKERINDAAGRVIKRMRMQARLVVRFQGHSHHGGDNWAPLALSTVKRKGNSTILYRSGRLLRGQSVKGKFVLNGRTVNWTITLSNSAEHALFHQFGFEHIAAGPVIARPPQVFTREDRVFVREILSSILF